MPLPQDLWIGEIVIGIALILVMATSFYGYRVRRGRWWLAISFCISSYVLCIAVAIGHDVMSRQLDEYVRILRNPARPAHLAPDWGNGFTREDRTKYSHMLASSTYEEWGETVSYFDVDGKLRRFEPTSADQQKRSDYLQRIELSKRGSKMLMWSAIAWLLLPLIGVGLAHTRLPELLLRALTSRSKRDAGAPLS